MTFTSSPIAFRDHYFAKLDNAKGVLASKNESQKYKWPE
jgi:hypothetical protein